jgi:hypothetical protein
LGSLSKRLGGSYETCQRKAATRQLLCPSWQLVKEMAFHFISIGQCRVLPVDNEVASVASKENGSEAIEYLSKKLQADEEVILAACRHKKRNDSEIKR